jgi:hypothetical protein
VSPKCHKSKDIDAWSSEAGFQGNEISDSLRGNLIRTPRLHAFADPISRSACRDRRPATSGRQAVSSPPRRAIRHSGDGGRGQLVPSHPQLHRCSSRSAAWLVRVVLATRAGLQHDPVHSPAIGYGFSGRRFSAPRRHSARAGRSREAVPCRHRRQGVAPQLRSFPGPQGRAYFERVCLRRRAGAGAFRL